MKYRWDNKYLQWGITAFLVIAASMLFYYGIFHMKSLIGGIKMFLKIMAPIIYGFAIAYILSPVVNTMENKVIYPLCRKKEIEPKKRGKSMIRWFCVLFSMFMFLIIIYALIMMILPQLIRSIMNIIYSFPNYVKIVESWLNRFIERGGKLDTEMIDMLNQYSKEAQNYLSTTILPQMQSLLRNVSAGVFDILIFLKNFLIGAIVSLYVLADKEVFVARSKMIVYAVMPAKRANTLIHAMRFTHKTFGGFISGKILDSAIIGVLCYIGTVCLDMPYAILISVVVGVTNVIPFFGPYLGAIPCILLILLVDPLKSLYFIIFILVLQQFDGNILGPKILGESTGLSSFMVIVAIMIGGGIFGIPGMIVGVPVCAVIYASIWKLLGNSLEEKEMPSEVEEYYKIDCLDAQTHEKIPMPEEKPRHQQTEDRQNNMFMKVWNILQKFVLQVFHLLKVLIMICWEKLKSWYILIKHKIQDSRRIQKFSESCRNIKKNMGNKIKELKNKIKNGSDQSL